MRIGLIARADQTGLGHQTWEFYQHMKPHKTLVINLDDVNAQYGKITHCHAEWYPERAEFTNFPLRYDAFDEFLKDIDVVFTVETPYNFELYDLARERGIKIIEQYNYEFLELLCNPSLPHPDVLAAPTAWHKQDVKRILSPTPVRSLPVPVALERFTQNDNDRAVRFLHLAGIPAHMDRNGTELVREAARYLPPEIDLTIRDSVQDNNYWESYDGYDVLVIPRRYGGLCLQIQEAMAAGLVVICGEHDVYAQTSVTVYSKESAVFDTRRVQIQTHDCEPVNIASAMINLHENDKRYQQKKLESQTWAKQHSWKRMAKQYHTFFKRVVE